MLGKHNNKTMLPMSDFFEKKHTRDLILINNEKVIQKTITMHLI